MRTVLKLTMRASVPTTKPHMSEGSKLKMHLLQNVWVSQDDTEIALFSLFEHQNIEYFLILLNEVKTKT